MRPLWVTQPCPAEAAVLKTCSVLSVQGKKVLHIDRNNHYGGYVNLGTLFVEGSMLTVPASLRL